MWTSSQGERARWVREEEQVTASKVLKGTWAGDQGEKPKVPTGRGKRGVQIEVREGVCSLGLSKQSPEIINQMGTKQKGEPQVSFGLTG